MDCGARRSERMMLSLSLCLLSGTKSMKTVAVIKSKLLYLRYVWVFRTGGKS